MFLFLFFFPVQDPVHTQHYALRLPILSRTTKGRRENCFIWVLARPAYIWIPDLWQCCCARFTHWKEMWQMCCPSMLQCCWDIDTRVSPTLPAKHKVVGGISEVLGDLLHDDMHSVRQIWWHEDGSTCIYYKKKVGVCFCVISNTAGGELSPIAVLLDRARPLWSTKRGRHHIISPIITERAVLQDSL